jgi:hypothetical protein
MSAADRQWTGTLRLCAKWRRLHRATLTIEEGVDGRVRACALLFPDVGI